VTERGQGKPIAVIHPIGSTGSPQSLEARIAALSARGEISAPEGTLAVADPAHPSRRSPAL